MIMPPCRSPAGTAGRGPMHNLLRRVGSRWSDCIFARASTHWYSRHSDNHVDTDALLRHFATVCTLNARALSAGEGAARSVSDDDREAMYANERCAKYHKGTVLMYQLGCWHRGTPVNYGYVRCALVP
jgi:hypothetical protein